VSFRAVVRGGQEGKRKGVDEIVRKAGEGEVDPDAHIAQLEQGRRLARPLRPALVAAVK